MWSPKFFKHLPSLSFRERLQVSTGWFFFETDLHPQFMSCMATTNTVLVKAQSHWSHCFVNIFLIAGGQNKRVFLTRLSHPKAKCTSEVYTPATSPGGAFTILSLFAYRRILNFMFDEIFTIQFFNNQHVVPQLNPSKTGASQHSSPSDSSEEPFFGSWLIVPPNTDAERASSGACPSASQTERWMDQPWGHLNPWLVKPWCCGNKTILKCTMHNIERL